MLQISRRSDTAPAFIADFGDPLGLLVHCHRKIETQLGVLERASGIFLTSNASELPAALLAIEAAQAHFAGPGAKHTADEEESLFPRIHARCGVSDSSVRDALDELASQHRTAERAHADLDVIVDRLNSGGLSSRSNVESFDECVAELVALYRPHILLENEFVFPGAARLLSPDELAQIGKEMQARRRK